MRLREIKLKDFRCFERLTVSLAKELTVFVGNNGAGKTAVLDGIAYLLSRILTRLPGLEGSNLRRDDIRIIQNRVVASYARVEGTSTEGVSWSRTVKRDGSKATALSVPDGVGDRALYEFLDATVYALSEGEPVTLPVFAYYGVSRAVLGIPERRRNFRKEFRRLDALEGALDATTRFKDLFEWFYAQERDEMARYAEALRAPDFLAWLKNGGQKPPDSVRGSLSALGPLPVLQAVRDAISHVVPGFSEPRIRTNPLRMVLTQQLSDGTEKELSLQMLSDGYRTMLAMVMDFARRMAQTNPHLENPLEAEAILMVDEIDLHLHPVWQQTVIPSFRKAFPNTQLIVSTHSPQVLTTVETGNIYIVESGDVRPCPAPTYGARSSDVVAEVLGLENQRPPDNPIAEKIESLFEAIDDLRYSDATKLREELRAWAKGYPEPDLVRADILLKRMAYRENSGTRVT